MILSPPLAEFSTWPSPKRRGKKVYPEWEHGGFVEKMKKPKAGRQIILSSSSALAGGMDLQKKERAHEFLIMIRD
jgi:hypothetical protein